MTGTFLSRPASARPRVLEEVIAGIDDGLRAEDGGLRDLVAGSLITLDGVRAKAYDGGYLSAGRTLTAGLGVLCIARGDEVWR